jgi:hypothetical protein
LRKKRAFAEKTMIPDPFPSPASNKLIVSVVTVHCTTRRLVRFRLSITIPPAAQ